MKFSNFCSMLLLVSLGAMLVTGCKKEDPPPQDPTNDIFKCGDDVTFIYNGETVTYGTVLSNGRCWLDRNLGAFQVAASATDVSSFGDLYQWGRGADGHHLRNSGTTNSLSNSDTAGHENFILVPVSPYDWRDPLNNNLWQGVEGINNPCPCGFRLPTEVEWDIERQSWISNDEIGAFASPLKLPLAGYRNRNNGVLESEGNLGRYWSSKVEGNNVWFLRFGNGLADVHNTDKRANGRSVRCIKGF